MNKLVRFVVVAAVVSLMASCGPAATPVPTAVLPTTTSQPTATSTPGEKAPVGQVELETVTLNVSGFT